MAGQDNPVKIICTAEDGTKKEYAIIARRAAADGGGTDNTTPSYPSDEPDPSFAAPEAENGTVPSDSLSVGTVLLITAAALGVGFFGGCAVKANGGKRAIEKEQ